MANTKHSVAREIIIDRLLHKRRGYSLYEMLETVNKELENNGFRPVSLNTIRNDIDNFRYLYKQKIEVEQRGYRNFYRYEDPNSTIFNNVLTFGEIQHLHSALLSIRYLDAFQGTHTDREFSDRLCGLFEIDHQTDPIVIYEHVPQKNELRKFQVIYEYIRTKTPVTITYIQGESTHEAVVHPYYLRQHNSNWNLLCHDATNNIPAEIPISNIKRMSTAYDIPFVPNNDFSLKNYYTKAFSKE